MSETQEISAARADVEARKAVVLAVVRKAQRMYIEEWSDEVTSADRQLEAAEKRLARVTAKTESRP